MNGNLLPNGAQEVAQFTGGGKLAANQYGYIRIYLDVSTSLRGLGAELARSFNSFLDTLTESWKAAGGDPEKLHVAVKVFNSRIKKLGEFTRIGNAVRWDEQTYDLHAGFGTALRDALFDGAEKSMFQLSELGRINPPPFFGVVLLSDGHDTKSIRPEAVVKRSVDAASAKRIAFHFCFVGETHAQEAARADAGRMGIDEATIYTAPKNLDGITATLTRSAGAMFHDPPQH